MKKLSEYTKTELIQRKEELQAAYCEFQNRNLHLDLSRGKPEKRQLELSMPMLDLVGKDEWYSEEGLDCRNYGGFEGLFTGDIGTETEKKLLPELEDVDFLKVGHHGSRYSTCQEFLDVVRPELAVVSCSATNTYGHPSGETIERLEDSGAKIWYTMKEGAVTAETDGKEVWVDTFVHP